MSKENSPDLDFARFRQLSLSIGRFFSDDRWRIETSNPKGTVTVFLSDNRVDERARPVERRSFLRFGG
jgi:hypothetical protein